MVTNGQTGGSKKAWSFDPATVDSIGPIRDALVHHDTYFDEDINPQTTLAIVLDKILEDLPQDLQEPVRLVYLENRTYRSAARTLGIDHKTVKSRVTKGIAILKSRLVDSVWIAEMLRGYIPTEEIAKEVSMQGDKVTHILSTLKVNNDSK
jgi:DNA-directed RNA polymerase specialized sigma24 family protein